jgi:hypothetical protein
VTGRGPKPAPGCEARRGLAAGLLVHLAALLALLGPVPLPSHAEAAGALNPFVALYTIRLAGIDIGEARRALQPTGNAKFVFQSLSRAEGLLSYLVPDRLFEESRWEYDASQRIRPLSYAYRRTGGSRERNVKVVFDWANHVARIAAQGQTQEVAIPEGTLDPLLAQIAITQDLAQGRIPSSYLVLDALKHRVHTYPVEVGRTADIVTPLGTYKAIELRRLGESGKRQLVIWCAPALGYLPARIDYTEKDGRSYRSVLRSLDWSKPPAAAESQATREHRKTARRLERPSTSPAAP